MSDYEKANYAKLSIKENFCCDPDPFMSMMDFDELVEEQFEEYPFGGYLPHDDTYYIVLNEEEFNELKESRKNNEPYYILEIS